jgi:glycosyltransferase involved in cell wall biosynthesis
MPGRLLHLLATNGRRGAETFAVGLAARLDVHGWESELLAIAAAGSGATVDVPVSGRGRTDPRGLATIAEAARRADVIVAHGSSSLLVGAAVAVARRRPWVYRNIGDPAAWGQVRLAQARVGLPLRAATTVVTLYEEAGATLRARYRVSPHRIQVIPNAADPARFAPPTPAQRRAMRGELDLDERPWVLWIGALSPEKRPLLALDLVAGLPDVGLVLVGDGPLRAEVAAAARRPDLHGRVRLLGPLADPSPAYKAADLLLMTSRTEGMPAVAIEAAMCGLAIVAPPVGALPQIVATAGAGTVAPDSSLGAALASTLLAPVPVDRAAVAARYAWPEVTARWDRVLVDAAAEWREAP